MSPPPAWKPKGGDILYVTRSASPQFGRPIYVRVIRPHGWSTYNGWIWLDGYELERTGEAVDRRSIFVRVAGLRLIVPPVNRRAGHMGNAPSFRRVRV